MEIIVAAKAGFCSGVRRALNSVLEMTHRGEGGSILGPLAHNEEVVVYLSRHNVSTVHEPAEATGSFIAIRTHGVTPELSEQLHQMEEFKIIDLTCPRVHRVQKIASELKEKNFNMIILGNTSHPEVVGLIGWAGGNATVISSLEELEKLSNLDSSALLAQSTADPGLFEEIKTLYRSKFPHGEIHHTLCPETRLRQEEAVQLAQRVEALIVVGSKTSANTTALYNCCRQLKPTCRITNAGELDRRFLHRYRSFGITAGASTPPWTIKEVVKSMENENLEMEARNDEQFEFDGEVKVAQVGEQVSGKIARVTEEEVYVDIGAKTEAILPVQEVHLDKDQGLTDLFAPEDDIEVTVLEIDDQDGKVTVSHKRLAREKRLQELEEAMAEDQILEGKVKQVVPAGIVIDLGSNVEGFMPGSLVDVRYVPDFKEFQNQDVQFKILEFDRDKGKLILSRKKIMEEENARKREDTLNALEVGSIITGRVKRLTNFGAFVDVGGIDGLVHISELSWERVGHPGEVLKNGEEVHVKVMEIIPEKERISLSIRKTQPDPWTRAASELTNGQIIMGKVTRLVNFGAFIEIKPGVEGLAHISQLADYHVQHPSEIISEGEEVEVKIIEVKTKAKRISLSLKDARGAVVAKEVDTAENAENGNVTLGDVFGNLFDIEAYNGTQEKSEQAIEDEDETPLDQPAESGEVVAAPAGDAAGPAEEEVSPPEFLEAEVPVGEEPSAAEMETLEETSTPVKADEQQLESSASEAVVVEEELVPTAEEKPTEEALSAADGAVEEAAPETVQEAPEPEEPAEPEEPVEPAEPEEPVEPAEPEEPVEPAEPEEPVEPEEPEEPVEPAEPEEPVEPVAIAAQEELSSVEAETMAEPEVETETETETETEPDTEMETEPESSDAPAEENSNAEEKAEEQE